MMETKKARARFLALIVLISFTLMSLNIKPVEATAPLIYCYDPLDSLSTITQYPNTNLNISLSTDAIGYTNSMDVFNQTQGTTLYEANSSRISFSTEYCVIGVWVKFLAMNPYPTDFVYVLYRLNTLTGEYYGLGVYGGEGSTVVLAAVHSGGSLVTTSVYIGDWNWIELKFSYTTQQNLDLYVNGTFVTGSGTVMSFVTPSLHKLWLPIHGTGINSGVGHFRMNYVRVANDTEFPPSYPFTVSIQGNASNLAIGDYLTLNGTISGGSGLYTRQLLYGDGTPIWQDFTPTTSTIIANFSMQPGLGNWTFKYRVDDSDGGLAYSDLWNVSVGLGAVSISLSANLEEIQGGFVNNWVFTTWKYYTFTLRVTLPTGSTGIVDAAINFTIQTESVGAVTCYFIVTNDSQNGFGWEYSSNLTSDLLTRFGEPVLLKTGEIITVGSMIYDITFPIWFQKQVLDEWLTATSVWGAANATNAINASWVELQHNYFCIYSRGGFSLNYAHSASDAYLTAGGTPFSFYATNGTSVYNEVWYRDVQHVKLLPDVQFKTGLESWQLYYGIDYVLEGNSSWQSGWLAQVNPYTVSYTGIFAGNVWINMTGNFKNRGVWDPGTNNIYMFYHGSVSNTGDVGHWKYWVDLWFSDTNASSAGAARINAYEYPMKDNSDPWLHWLTTAWGVKDDVIKGAQIEFPLLDSDGITPVSSGKIVMMRVWSNLTVDDSNAGQEITIKNFETFDLTHSKELPLSGIPSPVFDETKIPTVGNSGIFGAVFSLFSGIGQWLSENVIFGGLNLWGNFVNFLDTIAGWMGAPHFFSNLFSWIASGIGWLASGVGYIFTIIYDIFLLIASLMMGFLSVIGELIMSIVNTITFFTDLMSGVIGGAGNLWDQLGLMTWLTVFLVFYPLYLILLWEEKGTDGLMAHLTMVFGILAWLFDFFHKIASMMINVIGTLIESIPIVE